MQLSQLFVLLTAVFASAFGQELCDDHGNGRFNGIVPDVDVDNQLLIFKGDNYWRVEGNLTDGFSLLAGYPRPMSSYWPGLPKGVESAEHDFLDDTTDFIKGDQHWVFNGTRLLPGYPRAASDAPVIADNGDRDDFEAEAEAAATRAGWTKHTRAVIMFPYALDHVYFFNGTQYTKYRLPSGPIEEGYPKPVVPFWFQCPKSESSEETAT